MKPNIYLKILTFLFIGILITSCGSDGGDPTGTKLGTVGPKAPDLTHCNNGKHDPDAGEIGIDCGGPCNVLCCNNGKWDKNLKESGIDCGGKCDVDCCENGRPDPGEDKVDCGGKCPPCPDGEEVTCYDGKQNGDETGVDCGGSNCEPCPTCYDKIRNQGETGVDCGGPCANACPSCYDGKQNQGEERVDCGGPNCAPCLKIVQPVVSAPPPRRHGGTPPTRPSGPTEVEKKQKIIKDITIEVTTINNVINNIENNVKDIAKSEDVLDKTVAETKNIIRNNSSLKKDCKDHVARELQDLKEAQAKAEKAKQNLNNAKQKAVDIKNTVLQAQRKANDFFNTAQGASVASAAQSNLNSIISIVQKARNDLNSSNDLLKSTTDGVDMADRAVQKAMANYLEAKKNCPTVSCTNMDNDYKTSLSYTFSSLSKKQRDKDLMRQAKQPFANSVSPNAIFDKTKQRNYSVERFINRMNMEGPHQINVEKIELDKESCKVIRIEINAVELE